MVEFSFSVEEMAARGIKPWRGPPLEPPEDYALHMWLAPPHELDFQTACDLAAVDGEVYDGLWAWATKAEDLPDEAKLLLFTALVRKRPPKVRDKTKKNRRLKIIADSLKREYPRLTMTGDKGVAGILAELPDVGMDQQSLVTNVLYS